MAASKGRLLLIKRGDGATSEAFTEWAGLRSNSLTINNELIDITNKDSAGYRTLMAGGVVSVDVEGSGVFDDDLAYKAARTAANDPDQLAENYEITDGTTGDKFSGAFFVESVTDAGEHNGEVTYSVSLKSSGAILFTEA